MRVNRTRSLDGKKDRTVRCPVCRAVWMKADEDMPSGKCAHLRFDGVEFNELGGIQIHGRWKGAKAFRAAVYAEHKRNGERLRKALRCVPTTEVDEVDAYGLMVQGCYCPDDAVVVFGYSRHGNGAAINQESRVMRRSK